MNHYLRSQMTRFLPLVSPKANLIMSYYGINLIFDFNFAPVLA